MDAFSKALSLDAPKFVCYSACEVCPVARRALLNHDVRTRPRHVFGDVLGWLVDRDRDMLLKKQGAVLKAWSKLKKQHHMKSITKTTMQRRQQKLSAEYMDEMKQALQDYEFQDTCWCYVHCAYCPLSPRDDTTLHDH